jgi:hypothetical protein
LLQAIEEDIRTGQDQELNENDEVYGMRRTPEKSFFKQPTKIFENSDDSVVRMLQQNFDLHNKNGLAKCNDLVQALEFIDKSKLDEYQ